MHSVINNYDIGYKLLHRMVCIFAVSKCFCIAFAQDVPKHLTHLS